MKTVKFARTWPDRIDDTTVEEWPAGWSGEISDERAARAEKAGVLDGEPKSIKPAAKRAKPAARKTSASKAAPVVPAAPAETAPPAEPVAAPETGA